MLPTIAKSFCCGVIAFICEERNSILKLGAWSVAGLEFSPDTVVTADRAVAMEEQGDAVVMIGPSTHPRWCGIPHARCCKVLMGRVGISDPV